MNFSNNVDNAFILFNISSGFFFQFQVCIIYCFHAKFVLDFVLDVFIVVYTPRVYLIEAKVIMLTLKKCMY